MAFVFNTGKEGVILIKMNEIAVVIPAYNPEMTLINYINDLIDKGFDKIIVVNDGSSEECRPVFKQVEASLRCTLIEHPINKGKGRALKTAFERFLNDERFAGCKGVVTADADGQHSPRDTCAVAEALCENEDNFVLGVRDFDSEGVPFKSKKGNKITRGVMKLLFSKNVTDTQTGLRGLNREFIRECLTLKGERFEYEINMLILGMRTQNLVEIPIETIYFNQNRATSFKAVADSVKIYMCIFSSFFKFCFSSLSSSAVDIALFNVFTFLFSQSMSAVKAVFAATVAARIFSSFFNYIVNRNVVFKVNTSKNAVVKYYALVILIMLLSAILVTLLFSLTKWNKSLIKIAVDTVLFMLSYKVQQAWVFNTAD